MSKCNHVYIYTVTILYSKHNTYKYTQIVACLYEPDTELAQIAPCVKHYSCVALLCPAMPCLQLDTNLIYYTVSVSNIKHLTLCSTQINVDHISNQ